MGFRSYKGRLTLHMAMADFRALCGKPGATTTTTFANVTCLRCRRITAIRQFDWQTAAAQRRK